MSLSEDLTRTPDGRVSVALPGDATSGVVAIVPLSPTPGVACRSIRWMGAGTATLWYSPTIPRSVFTASETAAGVPVTFGGKQYLPLSFLSQGEEQPVQATALLSSNGAGATSTAGTYVVIY